MTFELNAASLGDAASVAELERALFSDPWSEGDISDYSSGDTCGVLLCKCGGALAGYAVYSAVADEAELLRIGVAEDLRRRGVGGRLISHLTEQLRSRGVRKVFLEVRASNSPAVALYASCGFSLVTRRRSYYRAPTEDALIMALTLDA